MRYPDTYTCGCGVNNSWAKKCEGQTTQCTSDCVKTFDISGSISIAESCSGGCCQKVIQASDGVGSNDNEQVQRVGDSCYKDSCGNCCGYCGDIPTICSCSKGCSGKSDCSYCRGKGCSYCNDSCSSDSDDCRWCRGKGCRRCESDSDSCDDRRRPVYKKEIYPKRAYYSDSDADYCYESDSASDYCDYYDKYNDECFYDGSFATKEQDGEVANEEDEAEEAPVVADAGEVE